MAKTLSVTVTGMDKVKENIERYGQEAVKALAGALYVDANELITEAKLETPVDVTTPHHVGGALRNSGHVLLPVVEANRVVVECGFGSSSVDYAIYVHEILENHHVVGNAKFLEQPFNRRVHGLDARIAARMKAKLGA